MSWSVIMISVSQNMAEEKGHKDEEVRPSVSLQVKFDKEISDQDLADLDKLASEEVDSVLEEGQNLSRREIFTSEEWSSHWQSAYVHNEAYQTVKIAKEGNKAEKTNLIIARDEKNDLVGYSVVTIDMSKPNPDRVTSTFIGVRPNFQRQGVGTELLKKRIQILLGMGITGYNSNVRPQALRLYDRLQIPYLARPLSTSRYNRSQAITVDLSHYSQ